MGESNYFESMRRKKAIKDFFGHIVLVIMLLFAVVPIIWMVLCLLMKQNDIAAGVFGDFTHWQNYIEMWMSIKFFT